MVESQPSKLLVTGSIPVSRSSSKLENRNWKLAPRVRGRETEFRISSFDFRTGADVAQLVEHVLGKDGVSGSIPLIGSRDHMTWDGVYGVTKRGLRADLAGN